MPVAIFGYAPTAYTDRAGFRIPNPRSTPFPWLERWTETDHQIQDMAHLGQGVLRGCQVRPFSPAAYKIRISSGEITLRGATAALAACEAIPNPPSGTLPRIDVAAFHTLSTGAAHVQMFAGTPSNNPLPPLLPSGYDGLAFVFIPASCKAIYANQIVSKRILVIPDEDITPRAILAGNAAGAVVAGFGVSYFGFGVGVSATKANVQIPVPFAGTIRNLVAVTTSAQPGDGDLVLQVSKNGVGGAVGITLPAGSVADTFENTVNTATVAQGDLLAVSLINLASTNSAAITGISLEVTPA